MPQGLVADRVINGTYGELFIDDEYLTQVRGVSFTITADRRDIMPAGNTWTRYKRLNFSGSGTITSYKATSKFMKLMEEQKDGKTMRQVTMKVILADPEALPEADEDGSPAQVEEVQLFNVKVWEVSGGFDVGEIVEESMPFTFEDFKVIKQISGQPNF